MTQIMSLTKPHQRRPGELGVHSVDSFNFVVPDLKQAQAFYTSFGLDVREEGNGLGLYTMGREHRWGRVSEGAAKKLTYVSFGVYPEDIDPLRSRLKQCDVKQLDAPAGFESTTSGTGDASRPATVGGSRASWSGVVAGSTSASHCSRTRIGPGSSPLNLVFSRAKKPSP